MSNSQDGREDGFMDKVGDAARNLFGDGTPARDEAGEQRYKDGNYTGERTAGQSQPYPMGDVADTAPGAHYGAGDAVRIGGSVGNYADDAHYQQAREQHMGTFDRDYDEYRREHGSSGAPDFGVWHTTRQGQRSAVAQVREHMEVVGNDGVHVGTVDKVRGEQIVLTKSDPAAGGMHHSISASWIQGVGEKVMLNRHGDDARKAWTEAEASSRALNEREGQGSNGPHILERSFSGTYDKG